MGSPYDGACHVTWIQLHCSFFSAPLHLLESLIYLPGSRNFMLSLAIPLTGGPRHFRGGIVQQPSHHPYLSIIPYRPSLYFRGCVSWNFSPPSVSWGPLPICLVARTSRFPLLSLSLVTLVIFMAALYNHHIIPIPSLFSQWHRTTITPSFYPTSTLWIFTATVHSISVFFECISFAWNLSLSPVL